MFIKLKQSNSRGFTIVETLIVLGVTGMMFLSTSLLVQGQIERNRYQDSMRQLQQLVQNTINDVANGYMTSNAGDSPDTLLIGKRFWFCADNYSPGWIADCNNDHQGGLLYTTTMNQNTAGSISFVNQARTALPGGLKFTHFRQLNNNGTIQPWKVFEFGSMVMFTDNNKKIGKDIDGQSTVKLFSRDWTNLLLSEQNEGGFMLCFEGYRKGSLELGSKSSGLIVTLNMEDKRCDL